MPIKTAMPYDDGTWHCDQCAKQVLVRRRTPDHTFHLLLGICTGGIWLVVWLFIALRGGSKTWRCWSCGSIVGRE